MAAQWYQSSDTVTASVKLKRGSSSSNARKKYTAEFKEQYCAIFEDGELFWECHLAGKVDPGGCKIRPGKVRMEIVLKKTEPEQWSEYEVERSSVTNKDSGNSVANVADTNAPPPPPPPSKRFVPEDLTFVNHVPHDFYDMGRDVVKLKIQLSGMNEKRSKLMFGESSLELKFTTDDAKFLRTHDGSSKATSFVWNIQLFDKISPNESTYHFKTDCIDVTLKKTTTMRWKTLEQRQHSGGITSSRSPSKSNPTNQIQASNQSPANQNTSGIDKNDLSCKKPAKSRTRPLVKNDDGNITPLTDQMNDLTIDTSPEPNNDVVITSSLKGDSASTVSLSTSSGYSSGLSNERLSSPSQASGSDDGVFCGPKSPTYEHRHSTPDARSTDHTPFQKPHPPLARTTSNTPQESLSHTSSHYSPLTSKYAKGILPAALEVTDPSYRDDQLGKPSMTGLCNVGNSCFMNSVVQCLSNTQSLRDFFVNGHYLANINRDNPLGFHGDLAKSFSFVIRKLWSGEYEYFPPKKLKSVIATHSSHFGGYQQHDSHEFMSYLLDGLHEDLNRVQKKPQTSPVESEDRPDMEVAEESWRVHKLRNDSFVVDLFQGQFKSTLFCPVCNKVSVTFDPFMSMSVPLPKKLRRLPVIFVSANPDTLPVQYVLNLPPEGNLELLKASVGKKTNISMTQLRVFEAYNGKFQTLMSSNQRPIKLIKDNDIIIVSEVLSQRTLKEKVVEINVIQRVQCPLFPTKCSSCGKLAKDLGEKKIQRCGKCKAVGYCSSECQRMDWSSHKMQCRQGRPTPVGLPFVISLPASQLTYSKLAKMAEKKAKFSVDVTTQVDDSSVQRITESVARENTDSTQENTEGVQENTDLVSNSSIQEITETEQAAVPIPPNPMYVFTPVDRYGDNRQETEPLQDLGSQPLTIGSQFLAMDWRNNPKDEGAVDIKTKPNMDHVKDSSCTEASSSPSDDITLEQCLELFTEPETLAKDEAWYCPECKEHREAIKQMSVWRLPDILILHLKRFSFYNLVLRDKISKMVTFPLRGLDMSPYMLGDAANNITSERSATYDLYATVNHYGTVSVGHYITCVRPPTEEAGLKEWIRYDDDQVYKVSESQVLNKNAYILFYQRRKPPHTHTDPPRTKL